MERVTVTGYI